MTIRNGVGVIAAVLMCVHAGEFAHAQVDPNPGPASRVGGDFIGVSGPKANGFRQQFLLEFIENARRADAGS